MKIAYSICLSLFILHANCFGQAPLQNNPQDTARDAIKAMAVSYVAAYNSRDAEKLSKCWSEKAVYVLPDSDEKIVGRDAIRNMFAEMFAKPEAANLSVNIDDIRFVTDNVAIEIGTSRLVRKTGDVSLAKYSAIHVKQNDQWFLDSVSEIEATPAISVSGPLAELEWMIGEWADASTDSTVETVCQWTKNKSFLTRTFRVSAPNMDELDGTQIVGWDPIHKSIRSWVFDSDGGFSEGIWKKKGDSWVVESTGFLADGRPVTSIQVFSDVEAGSFIWQSFGRRVDNNRLPDIEEIKIVRK